MSNKKLPDFKDRQSLIESAALIFSASTILRIAQGEACSVNTRVKPIFEGEDAENLIKAFDSVFSYLKIAYDAFDGRASELAKAEGSEGTHS